MGRITNKNGFTVSFAAILALVAALASLWIADLMKGRSRQLHYLRTMEEVYALAESGLASGMSILTYNPGACTTTSSVLTTSSMPGRESTTSCIRVDQPYPNSYYLVTSATVTIAGKRYSQRLHSYGAVSNVAEYFAAVNGPLSVARGSNLTGAKVYGRDLTFSMVGPGQTFLDKAEYLSSVDPPKDTNCSPCEWSAATKAVIVISTPANKSPVQLSAPLLFPQITPDDMARWRTLAGPHTKVSNFDGEIYPPGYYGFGSPESGDTYHLKPGSPGHTTNNEHHVYYYGGDMRIKGRIHGQILFVATGTIYIDGNLLVASTPTYPIPGAGQPSSSTVHQCAVLIPGPNYNVVISTNFYTGGGAVTQTIKALVLAPAGTFRANEYDSPAPVSLNYEGAMILGSSPNFSDVFVNRTYGYMANLKTDPPFFLASLTVIYSQFQQITSETGVFN